MLITCIAILIIVSKENVNVYEFIFIRIGFSIYAGWLTVATIENLTFVAKYSIFGFEYKDEALMGDIMLYVALTLYMIATFFLRNPVFGSVLIWASYAISTMEFIDGMYYTDVRLNALIVCGVQAIYVLILTIILIFTNDNQ